MDFVEFWTICSTNGIVLSKEQLNQIKRYHDELKYWNEKVNLISRQATDEILEKHILHSLSVLKYIDIRPKAWCIDIGTGGGLPGIPIAIAKSEINMLLVDSIAKKMKMTGMFAQHTGLRRLKALHARVENLANDKVHIGSFDFVFARAVGKISTLLGWVKKILKKDGKIILFKGGDITEEINDAKKMFPSLNINEKIISILGADWFEKDEKKIVICTFN
ncbi:MAG: 16S rRNA (guanine(527)-N(7))-methyltransferase RsmG [FCB group bacterium]|jgi:16S rRNA (guanine527-N7)-methyltransferase